MIPATKISPDTAEEKENPPLCSLKQMKFNENHYSERPLVGRCCWIFCIHATFHRSDCHLLENRRLNPVLQQNCSISHLFLNETTCGTADPAANKLHIRDSNDGSWDQFNFGAVHIMLRLPTTSDGDRQHQREHNEPHNSSHSDQTPAESQPTAQLRVKQWFLLC